MVSANTRALLCVFFLFFDVRGHVLRVYVVASWWERDAPTGPVARRTTGDLLSGRGGIFMFLVGVGHVTHVFPTHCKHWRNWNSNVALSDFGLASRSLSGDFQAPMLRSTLGSPNYSNLLQLRHNENLFCASVSVSSS